jgi:hypothetical protein
MRVWHLSYPCHLYHVSSLLRILALPEDNIDVWMASGSAVFLHECGKVSDFCLSD